MFECITRRRMAINPKGWKGHKSARRSNNKWMQTPQKVQYLKLNMEYFATMFENHMSQQMLNNGSSTNDGLPSNLTPIHSRVLPEPAVEEPNMLRLKTITKMSWYPNTQVQLLQMVPNLLLPTLDGAMFVIAARINGQAVLVLINTGASTRFMPGRTAERLGLKL